jgi:glycolate oxidase FAD binding subunit
VAAFSTAEKARRIVAKILDSPLVPSAIQLLNEAAAREVGRQVGVTSEVHGVVLAAAVASVPEAVEAQIRTAQAMAGEADEHEVLEGKSHDAFWAAVRDFDSGADMILKAAVLMDRVTKAMEYGERLATQHGLRVAVISEAGTGILRYHLREGDGTKSTARLAEVVAALREFAVQAKGSLVVLRAPAEVKALVDVWGPPGKGFALMQGLKEQFDPGRILNPGRFVGGL